MRLPLCLLLAVLAGCSTFEPGPVRSIEWQEWQDGAAMRRFCDERVPQVGRNVFVSAPLPFVGCYRERGPLCIVHTLRDDTDTLGHEVKHCFKGRFHG